MPEPSGCIIYTGALPNFIIDPSCNLNLDELLEAHADEIGGLLDSAKLSDLDKHYLNFNPATVDLKGLHQIQIDALQDHQTRISALETELAGLNVGNKLVQINLSCLTPTAAPCAQGTNTYSLVSLLTILVNEICQIKSQLA